jgi:hypothetical protein
VCSVQYVGIQGQLCESCINLVLVSPLKTLTGHFRANFPKSPQRRRRYHLIAIVICTGDRTATALFLTGPHFAGVKSLPIRAKHPVYLVSSFLVPSMIPRCFHYWVIRCSTQQLSSSIRPLRYPGCQNANEARLSL